MSTTASLSWREARRFRAVALKRRGWTQSAIAEALGVNESSVSRWVRRAEAEGERGLYDKPRSGRPRKLDRKRLERLPKLLLQGPQAHGFRGELWTAPRVAKLIRHKFGVRYSDDHVGKLLRELGWSPQKPVRRARQRDEEAIELWRREEWPRIKRGPGEQDSQRRSSSSTSPASTHCPG